jgi:hypothetical protein
MFVSGYKDGEMLEVGNARMGARGGGGHSTARKRSAEDVRDTDRQSVGSYSTVVRLI